ncbi:MAG: polysulfide reductase NrfD [Caldimicrobium sp.]|nr:polysulfide reductase NrfD [Caldimicrobium sp.]MCX7612676.1 polysulfide reductase NrfD [Caldimicrobium sp.]MDW8182170.1 NrfD/PsrC family molybdoenzyme membrane anchor subunit [Caldimicrobium sp.]
MVEKALRGGVWYWLWLLLLVSFIGLAFYFWLQEHHHGAGMLTGLHRDLTWGFHIGQLAFFVGVAASAVMIVLPYYFHNYKEFGKITVLAEFLAVGAVIIAMLSVFVVMGQPTRVLYVILNPTPNSLIFWDLTVLSTYLFLNLLCGWMVLHSEYKGTKYPSWLKPFIYWAILWGPSIHIVTAFLLQGLPGRHYWLTAIMAPRFLASAFSAGPALLIVIALLLKKIANFNVGDKAIQTISKIVIYAFIINLLFLFFEVFTAFYSGIHSHMAPFLYLFFGYEGHREWVPVMWASMILGIVGLVLLLIPSLRRSETTLTLGAISIFLSVWIEKGVALMVGGFTPNVFETVTPYKPTIPEIMIATGVWSLGLLIITVLYKITLSVYESKNLAVKTRG